MSFLHNIVTKIVRKYGYRANWFISKKYNENFLYNGEAVIDLYTVAFNNAKCIEYQIKLLNKNMVDKYNYFVIDNSTNKEEATKIQKLCKENGVNYYKVNVSIPFTRPSLNHACVLNWIYANLIKNNQNNFAFLDHDIFPTKPLKISDYINDKYKIAGYVDRKDSGRFNVWVGLYFCSFDLIKNYDANFVPIKDLDTGGMMYFNMYSQLDDTNIIKNIEQTQFCTNNPNAQNGVNIQQNYAEYYDNAWLHIIGASGWTKIYGKNEIVYKLLDEKLA